jgi:polyphosphate kinase 2 (PPK2 family)
MPLPTSDQIEKARLKANRAKACLQALEARLNKASRKLDTRRKIILGGLLIDAAGKDERYAKVVTALSSYRETLQPVTWPSCVP